MDGKQLSYQVQMLLQEGDTSTFINDRITYDYLYEAACELVGALRLLTATQTITTTATTSLYDINADYLCMYIKDDYNRYVLKYYDASGYTWVPFRDASFMYQANSLSDASIPDNFSIVDKSTLYSNISSTATSTAAASGGECTLTDLTTPFANVSAGDQVHNTTDGSDGVVISKTSSSILTTALFNGTANDWTSGDSYVIVPQSRRQLYVDPPSLTAGHTITFKYVSKPEPVYSEYRSYRIPSVYLTAVCKYAAWLYKYRDREPNFGDAWYKYWDAQLRKASMNENRMPSKTKFGVNFKKTSFSNRSMR